MGEASLDKHGANVLDASALRYDNMKSSTEVSSSALADLKDPIQVHLLTETALSDSQDYKILTQEEVDKLKKQCLLWSQRVDITKSNLAIQSKYRDAAISMAKLHSAGKTDEQLQRDEAYQEVGKERHIMEKKCDDLSRELLDLEQRLLDPQRRLLQHTAGILQLTHKVSKRKAQQATGQANHGIPSSPESLYTLSQSRDSLPFFGDEHPFDAQALFPLNDSSDSRQPQKNIIDIPLRSPSRGRDAQLRSELDVARGENTQLNAVITEMGKKLALVTGLLRETIIKFNPEANGDYDEPAPSSALSDTKPSDFLRGQVEYLETGLVAVQAEQESVLMSLKTGSSGPGSAGRGGFEDAGQIETVLTGLWDKIQAGIAEAKQRNEEYRRQRAERGLADDEHDALEDDMFDPSEAYSLVAFASRVEWLYRQTSTLKDQKSVLKRQIKQQRELNNRSDAQKDEEIERRGEELDQTRMLLDRAEKDALEAQTMLSEALQDLEAAKAAAGAAGAAEGELHARGERIESLQREVQAHTTRIGSLEEDVHERGARIESLEQDAQARGARIESLEQDVDARGARIESLEAEIESRSARVQSLEGEIQARSDRIEFLEGEIETRSAKIQSLETQFAALASQRDGSGQQLDELGSRLKEAARDRDRAEESARSLQQEIEYNRADMKAKDKELAQRESEMEQLNMTIAELKTEVTIARAELDGAYGSRAERAADVAALKNDAEVVKLRNFVERLKKELAGTVADLEAITKETIGTERARLELEQRLDAAMLDKTALEAELDRARAQAGKLQEELDNERFKVVAPQGGASRLGAGASMLSEQFRSTMREERKKFQEDMREERAKIRRLEEELNRLKRSQGPRKSSLGSR
ncbi:hypothetical protein ESCO_005436 [Escovopsis weberi]|uniref:Uncharacterized protein n=1 Tax=Escovopsis weberi TaxID=150374 RepID=A0A0M8N4L2_ESCWE|nr:hypothetical protein ESCO_005436 [Escovopsis weberi]